MNTGSLRSNSLNKMISLISLIRPVPYVAFQLRRMQCKQWIMRWLSSLSPHYNLIIYCLYCITICIVIHFNISRLVVSNAIQTIDNEVTHLIITSLSTVSIVLLFVLLWTSLSLYSLVSLWTMSFRQKYFIIFKCRFSLFVERHTPVFSKYSLNTKMIHIFAHELKAQSVF